MPTTRSVTFRDYAPGQTRYPIRIVTPDDGYYIHTFFDVKPWSPSGRYLACLKLPFQDRLPGPDDEAIVCIIDLQEQTLTEVAPTKGWGMQVGAHLCWGSEEHLYYNDKEGQDVFAVQYNRATGESRKMAGPVYQVTPDGRKLLSPSLSIINHAQNGYGATIDDRYDTMPRLGAPDDEGLWCTDVETNNRTLLFSLRQAWELLPDREPFRDARFTFFHTKINAQQDRIMQVVRCLFDDKRDELKFIVTMDMDGGNPHIALPYELWLKGSHHPDWHPDGRRILMNIKMNEMRFCLFDQDGSRFRITCPQVKGGGHPSVSPNGGYIVTDAYTQESFANERHEVPIRLVEAETGKEEAICYIWTLGGTNLPAHLRCDPHPVWSGDGRYVCFNGTPSGSRQILIADLGGLNTGNGGIDR